MITNKITKLGAALAMLGLGLLAACGENNVASSYSETQTGKPVIRPGMPIAELDTTYIRKIVDEGGDGCHMLAKSAVDVESDDVTEIDSAVTETTIVMARITCKSYNDIHLFIKTRAQVVDDAGAPVVGAIVYEKDCSFDDKSCQHVTNKDGYFYIDSVNFQTYYQNESKNPKYAYAPRYHEIQLRALSADSNFGALVSLNFADATVESVDDIAVADLGKIVVEPVYSAKVYLDSLFATVDENTPESDKPYIEEWNETMTKGLGEMGICASGYFPCYKAYEEDYKNGYVVLFGLPEGTYKLGVSHVWGPLPQLVVTKP